MSQPTNPPHNTGRTDPPSTGDHGGKPIYPNEIDHGYDQPLSGGHDIMKRLQNNLVHEQGRPDYVRDPNHHLASRSIDESLARVSRLRLPTRLSKDDEKEARHPEGKKMTLEQVTAPMSPEDKKKFKDKNEEHGDKFKGAASGRTIKVRHDRGSYWIETGGQLEGPFTAADAVFRVEKLLTGPDDIVLGPKYSLGRAQDAVSYSRAPFVVYDLRGDEVDQGYSLKSLWAKYFPRFLGWRMASGDEKVSKHPKGEKMTLEQVTEDLTPEGKKKFEDENEENRDQFTGKSAARARGGLYGYTKAVQSDCEVASRRVAKIASRLAKSIYGQDERTAQFLATHSKRAKSLSADILMAAMTNIGPKFASLDRLEELREQRRAKEELNERSLTEFLEGRKGRTVSVSALTYAFGGQPQKHTQLLQAMTKKGILEKVHKGVYRLKLASDREAADYSMYGYPTKTVRLAMGACSTLREEAGRIATSLHRRRTARHGDITGFFNQHAKAAQCRYAEILGRYYPDAEAKLASAPVPDTVEGWLTWEE